MEGGKASVISTDFGVEEKSEDEADAEKEGGTSRGAGAPFLGGSRQEAEALTPDPADG